MPKTSAPTFKPPSADTAGYTVMSSRSADRILQALGQPPPPVEDSDEP